MYFRFGLAALLFEITLSLTAWLWVVFLDFEVN
jgi:hypothetical protein